MPVRKRSARCRCGLIRMGGPDVIDGTDLHTLQYCQFDARSVSLYPDGTDLLWQAVYRKDPKIGRADGVAIKISGRLVEATAEAERIGRENGWILQMLHRRY